MAGLNKLLNLFSDWIDKTIDSATQIINDIDPR